MKQYQFLVGFTAACSGILFGYEIGLMNIIFIVDNFLSFFKYYYWENKMINDDAVYQKLIESDKKKFQEPVIITSFLFGAVIGVLVISKIVHKLSGQTYIMINALIFTFGSLIQGLTLRTFINLSIGQFISGYAVGGISVIFPVYLSEIITSNALRKSMLYFYHVMIAFGMVTATAVNGIIWAVTNYSSEGVVVDGVMHVMKKSRIWNISNNKKDESLVYKPAENEGWRLTFFLQIIPGILLIIITFFLPNSPKWLCSQVREEEALEVMAKLHSTYITDPQINEKLVTLQEKVSESIMNKHTTSELFNPKNIRYTIANFLIQFFQQWTGVYGIFYFQSQIYRYLGFSEITSTFTLPLINNGVNFFSSILGVWGAYKFKHNKLLMMLSPVFIFFIYFALVYCKDEAREPYQLNHSCETNSTMPELSYYSPELNHTFYGNACHTTKYSCSNSRNIVSFDNFNDYQKMDAICDHFDQVIFDQGKLKRYLCMISIFSFSLFYHWTWGILPISFQDLIYPKNMEVSCISFSMLIHFITAILVVYTTNFLFDELGMIIVFMFSCLISFIILVLYKMDAISIEDIEDDEEPQMAVMI